MAEEQRDAPLPIAAQQPTDSFQKLRFMVLGGDDALVDRVCDTILRERENRNEFTFGILKPRKAKVCERQVSVLKCPSYWLEHLKLHYIFSNGVKSIKYDLQFFQSQLFPGPHALLLVLRDFSNSRKEHLLCKALRQVFGKEILDYCMVLLVDEDKRRDPRKSICLEMCGNKSHILQNTDESVNQLFGKIETMTPWKSSSFFTDHSESFRKAECYFQEELNDKYEETADKLRRELAETAEKKIKALKEQNAKKAKELIEKTKELKVMENQYKDYRENVQKKLERLKDNKNIFFNLTEEKEKELNEREKELNSKMKRLDERERNLEMRERKLTQNAGSGESRQSPAETPPADFEDKQTLLDEEEEEMESRHNSQAIGSQKTKKKQAIQQPRCKNTF